MFHLHKALQASLFIAHLVHSHGASVLVHCSDGCVAATGRVVKRTDHGHVQTAHMPSTRLINS